MLTGESLVERAISVWVVGMVVLGLIWTSSYLLLPEGILRGRTLAGLLSPRGDSPLATFLTIGLGNLVVGFGGIIYMNRFRWIGDLPAGYIIAWIFCAFYGVLLGTNSFSFPGPTKYAPSVALLWSRSGLFEMSACLLVAATTAHWNLRAKMGQNTWLSWGEILILLLAVGLLAFAGWREAWQIGNA
jgi:hypothetical protein